MKWREWDDLPKGMQKPEVRVYYDILSKRKMSMKIKRVFDILVALVILILFSPLLLFFSILIKLDSKGPVFYRQERVTRYGKKFRMHKFRTMVENADKIGTAVTVGGDSRITRIGVFLRKYRLDELPQLIDVLNGEMSFVGTRPEVTIFARKYTPEMRATLLMPAGITSEASIRYKDEAKLLGNTENADKVYLEEILPRKMKYNLESIRNFCIFGDIMTIIRTVFAMFGKEYE